VTRPSRPGLLHQGTGRGAFLAGKP